jgi:hypothetical protein
MEYFKQFINYLVLLFLCCQSTLAADVTLTASGRCPQNSMGAPVAYRPQTCTLTAEIKGVSTDKVTTLPLEVRITVPHETSSKQDCKKAYDGKTLLCSSATTYRYVEAIVEIAKANSIKVTDSLGLMISPFDGTQRFSLATQASNSQGGSPYELLFNFTSFNGGKDTVKIVADFTFPDSRPNVGESIQFSTRATYNKANVDEPSPLSLVGTQLVFKSFVSDAPLAGTEAGNSVKVTAEISHISTSTNDAKNVEVSIDRKNSRCDWYDLFVILTCS